ncbi:MAG: hypothetical protein IT235_02905 [Bacteroidia bacterium]|nr:hypothetical protein [Bacteroidia bacterium]
MSLPNIPRRTLWDVEISGQLFAESYEWVINRVFDRGTLDEVFAIINYYGYDFVKHVLKTTNENLPNHSILLARAIFKLKYKDFQCSKRKPFRLYC